MGRLYVTMLGRLTIDVGGEIRRLTPTGTAVFTRLLVAGGGLVTVDELFLDVWRPGASGRVSREDRVQVQKRILEVRTVADARASGPHGSVLATDRGRVTAYRLALGRDQVDAYEFEDLVDRARASDPRAAATMLEGALARWTDRPLLDTERFPFAADTIARLSALRLTAGRELALAYREVGEIHRAIQVATSTLMLSPDDIALRRFLGDLDPVATGRDAGSAGSTPRREPTSGKATERTQTSGQSGEEAWVSAAASPRDGPPRPRELPPDVYGFTGRTAELAELCALLVPVADRSAAVVISALSGTAGVGKTALAIHFAHRVAGQFPDGQLYMDLHGYGPGDPVTAGGVLAVFLRTLGVANADIPAHPDERSARYRSLLAGRRMLVLLDNASDAEQVRPLLPGEPSCLVIVTSRDSLPGLVARDGAHRVTLDLLPPDDATALLRLLIGARIDAEPEASALLAERCVRLPLALRIAAELVVSRPELTIAHLVDELADGQRTLDVLDAGVDERTAVRAVFAWSLRRLTEAQSRLFTLLGLVPSGEFDIGAHAVTALAGAESRTILDVLTRAHLVRPAGSDRFGMHDLLRVYATELAADLTDPERRAATTRLVTYYLATAAAAMDVLVPHERERRPRIAGDADVFTDPAAAKTWLDVERANLLAAAFQVADDGCADLVGDFAATLWRYLDMGSLHSDALALHGLALRTARAHGDRRIEGNALNDLGRAYWRLARYDEAADHFRAATAIRRDIGDIRGEGTALMHLGLVDRLLGRFDASLDHLQQSLAIDRRLGNRVNEGRSLNNIGDTYFGLGRFDDAVAFFERALVIHRDLDDRYSEGIALGNLGLVCERRHADRAADDYFREALAIHREVGYRAGEAEALGGIGSLAGRRGRYAEAVDHLRHAAALYRETGDSLGESGIDDRLGLLHLSQGHHDLAREHLTRALAAAMRLGNRPGEATARNGLGETLRAISDPSAALAEHRSALDVATAVNDPMEQARAHAGLAAALESTGDPVRARPHREAAAQIYDDLGLDATDSLRARLTANGDPSGRHDAGR